MKGTKCYKCDSPSTSREHVPPICLFPEVKDLGDDYRKNLLTVPSCDIHNLKKTKDDEFLMICLSSVVGNNLIGYLQTRTKVKRALDRKSKGFIDRIVKDAEELTITTEDGSTFPLLSGKPDIKRLYRCIDLISSGIYYLEFGKPLIGEVKTLFGFIKYQDQNVNQLMTFFKDRFDNEADKFVRKGANQKVFYYQIIPPDTFGLIALKMTFYDGTDVYAAVADQDSSEPYDLGMKMIQGGFKTTIKYNGKNYEFND